MNIIYNIRRRLVLALLPLLMLAAGCGSKRIAWSPDGQYAAVIGEKGLYICGGDGELTGLLAPGVILAEWFPDSRRMAVVRASTYKDWALVRPLLAHEVQERIEQAGQAVQKEMEAGRDLSSALAASAIPDGSEKNLLGIYIRSLEGVRKKAGQNADFLESFEIKEAELCVASFSGGKLAVGQPLASGFLEIADLRVAAGGGAIAYTAEAASQHEYTLSVVLTDGSQPPKMVANHASAFPDWTADGRSLAFIKAAGSALGGDQLRLGLLARSRVVSETGQLDIQDKPDELAGLLFDESAKVRCFPDGRIVFSAMEARLPATAADMPQRQQLFALDPERQATLTALIPRSIQDSVPDSVNFFEVSPDYKKVSLIGEKNAVAVLALAAGTVEILQPAEESDLPGNVPVWRSAGELCFISAPKKDGTQTSEAVLWKDGKIRVLSKMWPSEVRKGLLEK